MAEAKTDVVAKPKKQMLMVIVIGAVGLVLIMLLAIIAFLMLRSSDPASGEAATAAATTESSHSAPVEKKKEKKKAESGHGKGPIFEKLPQFTVNLNSDSGEVMQTEIVLELPDASLQETVKSLSPKIQSSVNKLLSSKKPEELRTGAGRDKLEVEVKELVNKIIEAEGSDGVHSVNFTSFIIR